MYGKNNNLLYICLLWCKKTKGLYITSTYLYVRRAINALEDKMNETNQTIAQQINAKELAYAKFKLTHNDETNTIGIHKGEKHLTITYNEGHDLYSVRKVTIRKFDIVSYKTLDRIYFDQLKGMIEEFFNFEYVMEKLLNRSHNSNSIGDM